MASSFIVTITTSSDFDFGTTTSFIADVILDGSTTFPNITFNVQPDGITAISVPINASLPAGSSHTFSVGPFSTSVLDPPPDFDSFIGTFEVETDIGQISSIEGIIRTIDAEETITTVPASIIVACLHGSSLIQMRNGTKRLDQIKDGDEVVACVSDQEYMYAKVKGVAKCWLSFLGVDHDAVIFEPHSLGLNQPSQRLIIDPGHPMCTQNEFLEKGTEALRPAGTYWEESNGHQIHTKKWTDIFVQEEPSVRYDLILEKPFNTYIANGMVVRSKGYKDHRYKEFV